MQNDNFAKNLLARGASSTRTHQTRAYRKSATFQCATMRPNFRVPTARRICACTGGRENQRAHPRS